MSEEIPKNWNEMMVATYTICGELKRRMDSHSKEYADNFKAIFEKLDEFRDQQHADKEELLKKIQEVELNAAKQEGAVNTKMAVMNSTLSIIFSAATAWVLDKVKA